MVRAKRFVVLLSLPLCAALALGVGCGGDSKGGEGKPAKGKDGAKASAGKAGGKPGKAGGKAGATPGSSADGGGAAAEAWAWNLPKGVREPPKVPADNPMTKAKVELGHTLFMDKRLSVDGSRSCYSCHQNELGNADGREKALGAAGKDLPRNTPTIWNVGLSAEHYWDGRAKGLEAQAIGALKGGNMGLGDGLADKAAEVGGLPEYQKQFTAVFGLSDGAKVTPDHVAQALSAYERTLLCGDSAFDTQTMDEAAKRGWNLFMGKASCISCHAGDNFADGEYHRVGIGVPKDGKAGEGVDIGRGKVTEQEADNFKFRTPTMRNVSKTAPYFHDGSAKTLEEAVKIMASGGDRKAGSIDEKLVDRTLKDNELADLVAFLNVLECKGTLEVIGDQAAEGIAGAVAGGDAKGGDAKPGDAKPGDAKPGDAKAGDAKPGDAKAGDAKAKGDAKAGDAKAGHGKAG